MQSIELEGKAPAFGICVVLLQNVYAAHVLPQVDWFFDSLNIQKTKESWFASTQVSFDWYDSWHFYL